MQDISMNIEALDHITNLKDIRMNIRQLCSLIEGEVVSDRSMGINWAAVDNKPDVAETVIVNELIDKIERYEPRVSVDEIDVKHDFDRLNLNIKIFANEDYDDEEGNEEDDNEDD